MAVKDGPVIENIMRDEEVDIFKLPFPVHHEGDGGRYIGTACGVVARSTRAGQRAFFAEGLCSSYEAFHHTREQRGDVREIDDNGIEHRTVRRQPSRPASIVPIQWYEEHISQLIPSKEDNPIRRLKHPKIRSVVRRAVNLWLSGEKVLVFCFYRQTAIALRDHIRREVENASARRAAERLGLDPKAIEEAKDRLTLITKRPGDRESPFHREVIEYLERQVDQPEFSTLSGDATLRQRLVDLLAAYVRSAAYVSRFLPLNVPAIRDALVEGKAGATIVRKESRPYAKHWRDLTTCQGCHSSSA